MDGYLYGYGNPPSRLTLVQLEQRQTWSGLDPEFRRRLLALFDASNGTLGIGGGWRSAAQQEALFRSRYTSHDSPPGTLWLGKYWRLRPGMAPSTPPGRSYHEDSTPGGAIAADLIGNLAFGLAHGKEFGLRDLADVNDEPWHFQPIEVPTARRNHDGGPLARWPLPTTPTTPTTPEDDFMIARRVHVPGDPNRAEALVLIDMRGFSTPTERDTVSTFYGAASKALTAAQYDALLAVAQS